MNELEKAKFDKWFDENYKKEIFRVEIFRLSLKELAEKAFILGLEVRND